MSLIRMGKRNAKCQLTVDTNTIIVRSPGGPVPPITLEQMQTFSAPLLSRNPSMHFVFARIGMAEEQGLGLGSGPNTHYEVVTS